MSHEITIHKNGRVEMAYAGDVPWHGLGNRMESGKSIDDWAVAAGMAHRIKRAKVRFPVSCETADRPETYHVYDDKHVLFRSDTLAPLATVGADYKLVQPKAILEFFRDLVESAGFQLETAGTLFGGRKFWALVCIESATVKAAQDTMKRYGMLSTSCDGTMATEFRYTDIRTVCNNTLSAARKGGVPAIKISHRSTFNADAVKSELKLSQARDTFVQAMEQFRRMAETPLAPVDAITATAELLINDYDKMTNDQRVKAVARSKPVQRVAQLAADNAQIGGELAGMGNTVYGWLNAVTQFTDHEGTARTADARLQAAWYGKGADDKIRAYEKAIQMADGRIEYKVDNGALLESILSETE
jgi:phage/plasmid-like protein (TIGR03299 family)